MELRDFDPMLMKGLKGDRSVLATLPFIGCATAARLRTERPAEHGLGRPAQAFIQPGRTSASQTLRHVVDQLRLRSWPNSSHP